MLSHSDSSKLTLIKEIRAQLFAVAKTLNKEEDQIQMQIDHLNHVEFLLRNKGLLKSSRVLMFGEDEVRRSGIQFAKPEYAKGLLVHFEQVGRTDEAREIEIDEQIDAVLNTYQKALEKKRLYAFFPALGYGACIQAKTAKLLGLQKKLEKGDFNLDDLMHEYLWQYETSADLFLSPKQVIANERHVVRQILEHHAGETFSKEEDAAGGTINLASVQEYLITVNAYSEESFLGIASELKAAKKLSLNKKNDQATPKKQSERVASFFKNHWKAILIGAALGLAAAAILIGVGILTGGALPLFVAGAAALHIVVTKVVALAIGASVVSVGATVTGAASGLIVSSLQDKFKSNSTSRINHSLGIKGAPIAPTKEERDQPLSKENKENVEPAPFYPSFENGKATTFKRIF